MQAHDGNLPEFDANVWNRSDATAQYDKAPTSQLFPFSASLLSIARDLHSRNHPSPGASINLYAKNNRVSAALLPTTAVRTTRTFSENGDEILDELDQFWDDNDSSDEDDDASTASSMGLMSTAEKILGSESSDIASNFSRVTIDIMQQECKSDCFSYDEDDSKSLDTSFTPIGNHDPMDVVMDETSVHRTEAAVGTIFKDRLEKEDEDGEKATPSWERLRRSMKQSRLTQELLQEHDRKLGLPRSHCVTMMHTNRSRRQLEEGRILPKWNGKPLISKDHNQNDATTTVSRASVVRKGSKKQTTARAA